MGKAPRPPPLRGGGAAPCNVDRAATGGHDAISLAPIIHTGVDGPPGRTSIRHDLVWQTRARDGWTRHPWWMRCQVLIFYLFYCTPYGGRDTEYYDTCYKFHFQFGRLRGINLERNLVLRVISQTENGASNRNLLEPNLWRTIPTISPPVEPRSSFPNHIPSAQVYSSIVFEQLAPESCPIGLVCIREVVK